MVTLSSLQNALTPDSALKIFFVFLLLLAVIALFRRVLQKSDEHPTQFPADTPVLRDISESLVSPTGRAAPFGALAEPQLGSVQILKFYFATFDAAPGPPHPDCFADELFLELYNGETGHQWTQSYFVASPKGLEQVLKDKGWDSLFAGEVFLFRRYDATEVRRAVLEHVADQQKLVTLGVPEPPQEM